MNGHGWWWHLWNDPVNRNPWAFVGMIVTFAALFAAQWWFAGWRYRRNLRRDLKAQGEAYRRMRRGN